MFWERPVSFLCLSNGNWGSFNSDSWGNGNSWGSGISSVGEGWGSFNGNWGSGVSSVSQGWGSLDSDSWGSGVSSVSEGWGSFNSDSWGSGVAVDSGGNWLVDGVVVLVNDWGVDNLVNGADLVGLGNWVRLLDLDGVWLGNVGLVDNLSLDWDGVWDWDIDGVTVDLEFRLDTSHLGGDLGVSPDGSEDLLLSNGVSWGWSIVAGCWWDDWGNWGWDSWGSNWNSGLAGPWLSGDVCVSGLLFKGLAGNDVLVSGQNLLGSNLDGAGSNNSVVNNSLGYSWSGVDGLMDGGEGGSCDTGIADSNWCNGGSGSVVSWGGGSTLAQGDENGKYQKFCHFATSL